MAGLCSVAPGRVTLRQRKVDGGIGVQQRGIECRQVDMVRADQETYLGTAEDHAIGDLDRLACQILVGDSHAEHG